MMRRRRGRVALLAALMLAMSTCLFADGMISSLKFTANGTSAENPLGPAMDVIVDLITSPTAGFLVIGVFAIRCLIAYAEGDDDKVRKQFVQLVVVAAVVMLVAGFVTFVFSSPFGVSFSL